MAPENFQCYEGENSDFSERLIVGYSSIGGSATNHIMESEDGSSENKKSNTGEHVHSALNTCRQTTFPAMWLGIDLVAVMVSRLKSSLIGKGQSYVLAVYRGAILRITSEIPMLTLWQLWHECTDGPDIRHTCTPYISRVANIPSIQVKKFL